MKKILIFILFYFAFIPNILASYIVLDTDSNRIIEGSNMYEVKPVASISKMMTAILAIESNRLDDNVTVGDEIIKSYGSGIYIKVGEQLTLKDLLYGLMLRSGNDASYAIAKFVSGSVDKFVEDMNKKANEIGMHNTVFNNPNGLEYNGGNLSTAYDMAILSSYCIKNNIYKDIVGTKKYKLKTNMNYYIWNNKNKLLYNYKYTIGGKTGFTDKAKRTLVTNASKNNVNLTIVTLRESDDFNVHKNLYINNFKKYKRYRILKKGNINLLDYKIDNGNLYINDNYYLALTEDEIDNIVIKYQIDSNYKSISNGKVGVVKVYLNNMNIYSEDIYIKVKKKSIFQKIREWFNDK